jgi:hypothetical protein
MLTAMRHHQLTMIAPIDENQRAAVIADLDANIGYQCSDKSDHALLKKIDELHFISIFTFVPHGDGNPEGYLVVEANFDGPVDNFLANFTREFAQPLDRIFARCGRSQNESLTEFIRRHTNKPACFYVSCPGLSRAQIATEHRLVERLRFETDTLARQDASACRDCETVIKHMYQVAKHNGFLAAAQASVPFLVKHGQQIVRALCVLIPVTLLAFCVLAIGRSPPLQAIDRHPLLSAGLGCVAVFLSYWLAPAGKKILVSGIVLLALAVVAGAVWGSRIVPAQIFTVVLFVLIGVGIVAGAVAFGLYRIELLERKDQIDAGWIDIGHMQSVCQDENSPRCMQNHFINISIVKSGGLRLWALKLVLCVVHLAGIVYFNRGSLGGIPSIHFARWVILDRKEFDRPLLMFLTNYDGSWDSYLGDFVDEASEGVSGTWSNTGGFPRTWGLIFGGGSRFEKQFKGYARQGQRRSVAWFTAYPNVSVGQKLSNEKVRRELDKMTPAANRSTAGNPPSLRPLSVSAQADFLRRL